MQASVTGAAASVESVLLVPGMLCDAGLWAPQAAALTGQGYSVRVPDYGQDQSITAMARQVLRGAPPSFALVGHSMGGVIALEVWRQAPQRVIRLALMDTNAAAANLPREARRLAQLERALNGEFASVVSDELLPSYLSAASAADPEILATLRRMAMDAGPEVFARQVRALLERPDSRRTLTMIECPALVLCGAEDRLCPPALHADMAAVIPDSVLRMLPDAGHMPSLEQPAAVSDALLELLGR